MGTPLTSSRPEWPSADPHRAALQQIESLLEVLGVGAGMQRIVMALIEENAPPEMARGAAAVAMAEQRHPHSLGEIARLYYDQSRARNQVLGASVVQEGSWHMLLDLFAAGEEGRPISVSSLCIASGIPATTALTHIATLSRDGLIERVGDPNDRRRSWLTLTPAAKERMADMITRFTVPRPVALDLLKGSAVR